MSNQKLSPREQIRFLRLAIAEAMIFKILNLAVQKTDQAMFYSHKEKGFIKAHNIIATKCQFPLL